MIERLRLPRGLALALVIGAALRAWYFLDLVRQPFFGHLLVDARAYDASALAILAGHGFQGVLYRPPLYPLFLAGIYALFGHSAAAVVLVQMLLGLAAVVPVFVLARRWYGGAAAAGAALVVAAYPLRIYYEGEHLDVTLVSALLLLAVWSVVEGLTRRRGGTLLALGGTLLGVTALVRPNVLALLPFLLLGGWLLVRGTGPLPREGIAAGIALLLLALAPTAIHNWRAEGRFVPVAAYGGINFALGNAPGATGETPVPPGLRWEEHALAPVRQGIGGAAAQDAWWWRRGLAETAAHPLRTAALAVRKTLLFWNVRESSNNKALPFFTAVSPVTAHYRWWFGFLAALALAVVPLARSRRATGLLLCILAGICCSVIPFFVTARYRMPTVPFLAILAAGGVAELVRRLRAGGPRIGPAGAGWALACALAILVPWFGTADTAVDPDLQMGLVRIERGEPRDAAEHLRAVIARSPDDPDARNALGVALTALGDPAGAEATYRDALALGEFPTVVFNLGVLRQKQGDLAGAAALYRRTLELNPLHPGARHNLELLEQGRGE